MLRSEEGIRRKKMAGTRKGAALGRTQMEESTDPWDSGKNGEVSGVWLSSLPLTTR